MDIIEAYYAVAAHLREQAEQMLDVSGKLAATADRMCEDNFRNTPKPAAPDQSGDPT